MTGLGTHPYLQEGLSVPKNDLKLVKKLTKRCSASLNLVDKCIDSLGPYTSGIAVEDSIGFQCFGLPEFFILNIPFSLVGLLQQFCGQPHTSLSLSGLTRVDPPKVSCGGWYTFPDTSIGLVSTCIPAWSIVSLEAYLEVYRGMAVLSIG